MSTALDAYHSTTYASCPPQSPFFRSSSYTVSPLQYSNLLFIPLSLLAAYCILFKTPKAMAPMKWVYLNLHFWTSLLSLSVSLLNTPICWLPTISMSMLGLLSRIGVPEVFQAYLAMSVIMVSMSSIVSLFENRHHMIQNNRFRIKSPLLRWTIIGLNYIYSLLYITPLFVAIPDQSAAKLTVLDTIPCPYEDFFTLPVFTLTTNRHHLAYTVGSMCTFLSFAILQLNFYSFTCLHYLVFTKSTQTSRETIARQRKFFFGILIQISVPYGFITPATFYSSYAVLTGTYDHRLNNLVVLSFNFYGTVATLALIMSHSPYRLFIRELIRFGKSKTDGNNQISAAISQSKRST